MAFARKSNFSLIPGHKKVECDRCGFDYHIKDTVMQKGIRVDIEACKDDLDNQVGLK